MRKPQQGRGKFRRDSHSAAAQLFINQGTVLFVQPTVVSSNLTGYPSNRAQCTANVDPRGSVILGVRSTHQWIIYFFVSVLVTNLDRTSKYFGFVGESW